MNPREEICNLLENIDYNNDAFSEIKQILNNEFMDKKLYKYISIHNTDENNNLKIKEDYKFNQLRFANPTTYNDPFESIQIQQLANKHTEHYRNTPKVMIEKDGIIQQYPTQSNAMNDLVNNLRLCCFSENSPYSNEAMLMWSHYAKDHKGICLEFNFSDILNHKNYSLDINNLFLLPIIYRDKIKLNSLIELESMILPQLPPFNSRKVINDFMKKYTPLLMGSTITKNTMWSYENEWRMITFSTSPITLNPQKIYIGCKNTEDYPAIKSMCIQQGLNNPIQMNIERFEGLIE